MSAENARFAKAFVLQPGEGITVGGSAGTPTGTLILVPRGTPHSFANVGDRPVKALFIFSPPGMEDWFVELTARRETSPSGSLDWETIRALALKYGTEFVE